MADARASGQPALPPSTLRLRIDAQALTENWRALDRLSGRAEAGAAVKADCYGLGVEECLPTLREAGARRFFVAHWSEVPAVARHVPPARIAVLHGVGSAEEVAFARATGALPVINSLHQARLWREGGGGPCHLMIDTGINRLGLSPGELGDPAIAALEIAMVHSHLACADEDSAMNGRQLARFREAATRFAGVPLSLANSAGVALGSEYAFDLTRPGLALYGGVLRAELARHIRQVAYPQAAILQLRDLSPGESVGYNAAFTAPVAIRAAVVSLGYADGFLRSRGPGGALMFGSAALPILGKVSMDMVVVDLANAPEAREGDWLDVPFDLPRAARASGLSQYELLTVLGRRWRS